jgi:hypothetical protein
MVESTSAISNYPKCGGGHRRLGRQYVRGKKRAGVVKRPKAFSHAGLLVNGPREYVALI